MKTLFTLLAALSSLSAFAIDGHDEVKKAERLARIKTLVAENDIERLYKLEESFAAALDNFFAWVTNIEEVNPSLLDPVSSQIFMLCDPEGFYYWIGYKSGNCVAIQTNPGKLIRLSIVSVQEYIFAAGINYDSNSGRSLNSYASSFQMNGVHHLESISGTYIKVSSSIGLGNDSEFQYLLMKTDGTASSNGEFVGSSSGVDAALLKFAVVKLSMDDHKPIKFRLK